MILLTSTTDKLQLTRSSTADIDVVVMYMDASNANPPVVQGDTMGRQLSTFNTAATGDICAAPGSGDVRNVKEMFIRNRHASTSNDVTVIYDANGTDYELFKVTLSAGQTLEYKDGLGFYVVTSTNKLDVKLRVTSDVANATTSWADVTGLTYAVESGKHYGFRATLYHIENASTTGARFGVNGPAMTSIRLGGFSVFAGSLTAATFNAATADVAALDTSILGVTTTSAGTPQVVTAIMTGWFNPSAAGTFAVRCQSEIAVASGVTVKAGSHLRLWEFDN